MLSHVWLIATLWTAACQASLSFTISLSLLKLMPIESTPRIRWSEYWSFSFSISPSNECSGWFPLGLADLTSLLSKGLSRVFSSTTGWKHHSSVLSLFYGPTLSSVHDYWKNHSFGYIDLCWQSNLCFLICCLSLSTIWTHFRWSVSWVIVHATHFDI